FLGEGNVGFARVPTGKAPLCLAVAHQHRLRSQARTSAGPEVQVRGAATDLNVVPVGSRAIARALPLEVTAERPAGRAIDGDRVRAAADSDSPLGFGGRAKGEVAGPPRQRKHARALRSAGIS